MVFDKSALLERFRFEDRLTSRWKAALGTGERITVELCIRLPDKDLSEFDSGDFDQDLPSQLSDLYGLVGWNTDGWRTPAKNEKMLLRNGAHVAVWTEDRTLIGFGRVPYDEYSVTLFDLMTHPDHQRKGVGRLVVRLLTETYDQLGMGQMLVDGSGIGGFYESLGFSHQPSERVMYRR